MSPADCDVQSLDNRDIYEGVRLEEIRPFKEFEAELAPREGEEGWKAVNLARDLVAKENRAEVSLPRIR